MFCNDLAPSSGYWASWCSPIYQILFEMSLSLCDSHKIDLDFGRPKFVCHSCSSRPYLGVYWFSTHYFTPYRYFRTKHAGVIQVITWLERVDSPPCLHRIAPRILTVLVSKTTVKIIVVDWGHNIWVIWIIRRQILNARRSTPIHNNVSIFVLLIEALFIWPINSSFLTINLSQ